MFSTVIFSRVNISGNSSTYGGGVYNLNGTLIITDSTIANNTASNAAVVYDYGGTFKLIDSTVSGDSSTSTSPNPSGGGIYLSNNAPGAVSIINSTIANNTATQTADSGISSTPGRWSSKQHRRQQRRREQLLCQRRWDPQRRRPQSRQRHDMRFRRRGRQNTNPLFGVLTDNGGLTPTLALQAGSPAINVGDNTLAVDQNGAALSYDQRGVGFPRVNNSTVDIGAFESPALPVDFVVDRLTRRCAHLTAAPNDCTLRGAINLANTLAGTDTSPSMQACSLRRRPSRCRPPCQPSPPI